MRIACDTGGTFTDLVVETHDGLKLFKASTTPDDPVRGVLDALTLAAAAGMVNVAQGARGGLPGGPVQAFRRERDGTLHPQPACAGVELVPGQTIVSVSSGGGGYGPPEQRDPERVAHDVREGWVSRERAREVYGVEVYERGELVEATRERRAGIASVG
jgi:N-methylhydantoinase B